MTRRRKLLLIIGGAILVVVVAVAVIAILFFRSLSQPGEATARFVLAGAAAYLSINLRPGAGQLSTARDVLDRLQTGDFLDRRDELLDDLDDETGIHFLDDVTSWLGTDVSMVLLTPDLDRPEWVMLAQIGDRDAAEDFIDDLLDYLEDEFNVEFDSERGRAIDLWVADDEDLALGLTGDYLLIGDSEDTLEDMAGNIESPPARPLADSPDFIAARDSLPSERFMFLFLQTEEALNALEDEIEPYGDEEEAFRQARRNIPGYAAASATFISDGIRLDLFGPTPSRAFTFGADDALKSPGALPEDTLLLLSTVGVDRAWEETWDAIENLDPYTQEDFEELLDDFEYETGVDLERDVIDSLTGEMALALLPSDLGLLFTSGDESGVVELLLLAGLRDPRGISDALDTFTDAMEDLDVDVDRDSLGDYDLVTMRVDEFDFESYEPGYVVAGDWVAAGANIDGLEAFHDALTGDAGTLASNPAFERLVDLAPVPLHFLVYADLAGMLETIEDALDDDSRADYRREVEPYVEQLGALLAAASITEEEMRFSVILTLRE